MAQDEAQRLQTLQAQGLLDTPAEERFDRITRMAATRFGVPMATISLIDAERQWFKSRVGIDDEATGRDVAFCDYTIREEPGTVLVVEDATQDDRFKDNPMVTGDAHIRFYAGVPLTANDGSNLGSLCVIDTEPRPRPTEADLINLKALAEIVMDQIELGRTRRQLDERLRQLDLSEKLSRTGNWTFDTISGHIEWSDQVYAIHGVTPETFNPELGDALAFYVEEDRERVMAIIHAGMADGHGWDFDSIIQRADGSRRQVRSLAEPRHDEAGRFLGLHGVFKDLTDEREAHARALEQERRYRLVADNVSDVIAVYDANGVFSYLSPSIVDLLGYTPEELIGRTPYAFILPQDQTGVTKAFEMAAATVGGMTVEYRAACKTGEIRWLEARPRFQRDADGRIVEIIDCVRDVTERHEREQALHRAQAAAEQAAEAKASFLANMSHEIRTPLHGVIGFAEVLSNTGLDADQRRYVDRIRTAGRGLSALIDDILDLSKIDAGKMTVEARPFDLHALCDEVIDLTRSADGGRLDFALRIDPSAARRIVGDEQRTRQILLNLVGNAAKFTESGSIVLNVGCVNDTFELRVIDTGIGIRPQVLATLFEGFTQGDASTSRRFGGTGLGLTISRSLARLLGGDIRLESTHGEGTTAILTLPHAAASEEAAPAAAPAPGGGGPLRILAVDDVEANLELLGLMLVPGGHEVVSVRSGPSALARLRADPDFDLVLMDVQMPEMDGLEATRRIRAALGDAPPIIAVTANVMADQIEACRQAGMDGHLGKPVRPDDLQAVLARYGRPAPAQAETSLTDVLAGLKARYGSELQALAADLRRFDDVEPEARRSGVCALAHAIAGTSGSLGFAEVSDAAFAVEAAAREGPDIDAPLDSLYAAISRASPT